jgi:hypothetical protein
MPATSAKSSWALLLLILAGLVGASIVTLNALKYFGATPGHRTLRYEPR